MIPALYRLALWWFPPAFRAAYADCMTVDFEDGLRDIRRVRSTRRLLAWLALVVLDLAWAVSWQWLRTCVPWLTAAYAAMIITICEGLSAAMFGNDFFLPVALVPVVSGVTFLFWFVVPHHRRDDRWSLRA